MKADTRFRFISQKLDLQNSVLFLLHDIYCCCKIRPTDQMNVDELAFYCLLLQFASNSATSTPLRRWCRKKVNTMPIARLPTINPWAATLNCIRYWEAETEEGRLLKRHPPTMPAPNNPSRPVKHHIPQFIIKLQ